MWSRQQRQVRSLSRATPHLSPPCTSRHRVRRLPGRPATALVPATWYRYPSVLPVIASAPGWVEVRLAQRPNGATTWVPLRDVSLSTTPYRMVLNLRTEHLVVFEEGREILDFPAGIGSPEDPTVTGSYFVTMRRGAGPGVRTIRPGHFGSL